MAAVRVMWTPSTVAHGGAHGDSRDNSQETLSLREPFPGSEVLSDARSPFSGTEPTDGSVDDVIDRIIFSGDHGTGNLPS
jgi:hypothetical protein